MFGFTRKTDYALVALATLAQDPGAGRAPMSARRIAQQANLPLPLLMQLLQALHKAGILRSMRGAGGGYVFTESADRVSVLAVMEAIEGPVRVVTCCDDGAQDAENEPCKLCDLVRQCPITGALRQLNGRIADFLEGVTISDLLHMAGDQRQTPVRIAAAADSHEQVGS